jgi:hypothetical protein
MGFHSPRNRAIFPGSTYHPIEARRRMRIRPLHIALVAVALGATYAIASLVASFAEIKSVGEDVTAAAIARAQRTRAPTPDDGREATRSDLEARGEPAAGGEPASLESSASGFHDSIDPEDAASVPGVAEEQYDLPEEEVDFAALEEEERYRERFPRDATPFRLDDGDGAPPPPEDGEEDGGFAEDPDDVELDETTDGVFDDGARFDEQ